MSREVKIDSNEYEISIDDIRNVCDDFGCEADPIIGILLELHLISIRQNEETISNFKGTTYYLNLIPLCKFTLIFLEHSILSDIEEDCKETFIVPSLVSSKFQEPITYSETDLEFYIHFIPILPGRYKVMHQMQHMQY